MRMCGGTRTASPNRGPNATLLQPASWDQDRLLMHRLLVHRLFMHRLLVQKWLLIRLRHWSSLVLVAGLEGPTRVHDRVYDPGGHEETKEHDAAGRGQRGYGGRVPQARLMADAISLVVAHDGGARQCRIHVCRGVGAPCASPQFF